MKRKWQIRRFLGTGLCLLLSLAFLAQPTMALSGGRLDFFDQNGIYYYNPGNSNCTPGVSDASGVIGDGASASQLMRKYVEQYGEYAQELQIKYGMPWEFVFAQMQIESQFGTNTNENAVNYQVAKRGYYNWLGITGSGDAGSYTSSSGRRWAMYTSVKTMMNGYAGPQVFRGSNYGHTFRYLDPNNYDLSGFAEAFINKYAPKSENDTDRYIRDVNNLVASVRAIAKEKGWPTSEEIAKQHNIRFDSAPTSDSSNSSSGTSGDPRCIGVTGPGEPSAYVDDNQVVFLQCDSQWGGRSYGSCGEDSTICDAGCGPTSLAMVITALTGNRVSPITIADTAVSREYRVCGSGSSWNIADIAKDYGLKVRQISTTEGAINETLMNGGMVLLTGAGSAPFTSGGHFIAIRGITAEGKWKIFDSNRSENNSKEWAPNVIISQAKSGSSRAITR